MTSTVIPSAMQFPSAKPSPDARTIGVAVFVAVAHLALFAAYVTFSHSGMSGLRNAHAVAPSGPLEVVLLTAPTSHAQPAPATPPLRTAIRQHPFPPAYPTLRRKSAPAAITAPAEQAAPTAKPAAAAASAASAVKPLPAPEAARFSARSEPKRADEVDCTIPTPAYPPRARRLEEEGTATVRMTLDTRGHATDVSLEQGTGFADLDSAALDAVRDASCEPYVEHGEAVPVSVVQSIDFKLARP